MDVYCVVESTTDVKTSMMPLADGTIFELRSMPVGGGAIVDMLFIKFNDGSQFQVLQHLGSGLYSHVFLVECCFSKQRYALKLVPALDTKERYLEAKNDNPTRIPLRIEIKNDCQAQREIWFHYCFYNYLKKNTGPPNVVQAHKYWQINGLLKKDFLLLYKTCIKVLIRQPDTIFRRIKDNSPDSLTINLYFILMPYFPLGTLATRIRENTLSDESRLFLFKEILTGVAFLHKNGLIHRRLRPSNILLYVQDGIHAVIAGFGRLISCGDNPEWDIPRNATLTRRNETDHYEAPEVKGTEYNQSCDYYSIGVIGLELLCNVRSNEDLADAILYLQDDSNTGLPKNMKLSQTAELWLPIIKRQLSRKKEERYSCEQLLQLLMCGKQSIKHQSCESTSTASLSPLTSSAKILGVGESRQHPSTPSLSASKISQASSSANHRHSDQDYEMQDVEYEGEVHQTRESTTDESLALFNIASQDHNRSVSSPSASSSTVSLVSQTSSAKLQGEGELRQLPSTPSLSAPKISRASSSANRRHSDQCFNIADFINANILPKGDQWIKDELEKGREGDIWRLLIDRLDSKAVGIKMTRLDKNFRESLIQDCNPKPTQDKNFSLLAQLEKSKSGAFQEFVKVLGQTQPDLATRIFMNS